MKSIILATVFFLGLNVFADSGDAFSRVFLNKAVQIPTTLINQGYSRFGTRLELNSLLANMSDTSRIQAKLSNQVGAMNGNGRMSAHWSTVNGFTTIFVDPDWWKMFAEQQPVLALHEYLGPLGFVDDQYWISISMWFLTLLEEQNMDQNIKSTMKRNIIAWIAQNADDPSKKGTQLAGGVVGVGGGGEGASIWARMRDLREELSKLGGPQSPLDRQITFGLISRYLTSNLTVSWPVPARKK